MVRAKKTAEQVRPVWVYDQNRIEDGITISIKSTNKGAPGETSMPLTDFLQKFGKKSERTAVKDAVHYCLRSTRN